MMKKLLCSLILIITTVGFVQAQQDINLQGNTTTIIDGDDTPDLGDHTSFGQVTVGSSLIRTYTIQNIGTADLNIVSVGDAVGTDGQFGFDTSGVTTPIPAGENRTFTVTLTAATVGLATGGVVIVSNDPDTVVYDYSISADVIAAAEPDINVQGNGNDIADDDTDVIIPSLTNHTDFGDVAIGSSLTRTYTIQNTGTQDLSLFVVNLDLSSNTQFTLDNSSTGSPVSAGESTTFTVTFTPTVAGAVTGEVNIVSNDPDTEASYTFNIGANAISSPDINVQGNGNDIADDDADVIVPSLTNHTDFGQVTIGSPLTRTYTIQNTGNQDLTLSVVNLAGGSDAQFTLDNSGTGTTVTGGSSTTFTVTFTPTVAGAVAGEVIIVSNDPDTEMVYTFNIAAEAINIVEPDINVQGNGNDIADDDSDVIPPSLTNHTDFGSVTVGSTLTRTYTIQNTGNQDLTLSVVNLAGGSDAQFTLDNSGTGTTVTGGSSTTFTVTFTPTVAGAVTGEVIIVSNDPDTEAVYTFNIGANGVIASEPEMDVFGNGVEIADGDNTPDVADDTNFGQTDLTSGSVSHTFTIENNGGADLDLDGSPIVDIIGANPTDFTVSIVPTTPIVATGSTTFTIIFNPSALGIRNATVSIANNDSNEDPYTFDIQGEGIDANTDSPLLITQYYEVNGIGVDDHDSWIEVKNISQTATVTNAYHLALYEDLEGTTSGFISSSSPTESIAIPALNAGDVVLFRRSGSASLTNLGSASVVDTEVCRFDGNDIILISSSNGSSTYNDRIDIMGVVGNQTAVTWGVDTSLIKGCGTTEAPATVYDANQYITLELTEVDNATVNTNLQLGTQTVGPTIWTASWDNSIPDKTKNAIINGTYNNSNGSFESCNLTVNGGATINLDSGGAGSNYILVEENLTVNGTFIIGDTEALVTVNPDATMTGSIQKNETTTPLNNFRDFTYWSSPVNTTIEQAFNNVDPTRIFQWEIPSSGFAGDWSPASGTMTSARGYISEAPSVTPDGGTHSVSFIGTPNHGTESIIVGFNTTDDPFRSENFNLIGNPYPSAINIDDFINATGNNDIDGTIWLWTHNTAIDASGEFLGFDYATYNLTGGTMSAPSGPPAPTFNIGSGQSFFVYALSQGPVFFENSMRLQGQNTQFFRAPDTKSTPIQEKDRVWLNVESSTGGAFSQILVGFFDTATDGYDRGYDGTRLGGGWIDFYSKINADHYAVQGLHTFNIDKEVQIGFDTYIPGAMTYKISIYSVEGVLNTNDIYLVDHELNTVHDLKLADYEFDVNGEGLFPDRFTLQFTSSVLGIDDVELTNNFVVINEENTLRLRSTTVITHLKVYDMMGRLLIDKKPNDSEFAINTHSIRKGTVLILNATFDNGAEVSKKAIKY